MAAKKECDVCSRKFKTYQGLGGHLSGPCGSPVKKKVAKARSSDGMAWTTSSKVVEAKVDVAVPAKPTFYGDQKSVFIDVRHQDVVLGAKRLNVYGHSMEEVLAVIDEALAKSFGKAEAKA